MKKLLTTLGCGLILAAGFTANAAQTTLQPSLLSPDSTNPYSEVIPVGEWWPNRVVVTWENQTVKLNTSNAQYDDGYIISIPITVNGESVKDDWDDVVYLNAHPVYWIDEIYFGYWGDADEDNPGTAIALDGFPTFYSAPSEGEYMDFTLPADCVLIGENEDTNAAFPIQLTVGNQGNTTPKFYVGESFDASPDKPKWALDNKEGDYIMEYYFKSNKTTNLLSNIQFEREDGIVMPLEAVQGDDGNYLYTKASNGNNIVEYIYYFNYSGNEEVTFTLMKGDYITYPEFELGKEFTPTPGQQYKMYNATLDGDYYIATSSSLDIKDKISLTNSLGTNLAGAFTKVENVKDNVFGYNGHISVSNTTLTFTYTGSAGISFTIGEGIYTEYGIPEYLEDATYTPDTVSVDDAAATIEITWGEEVSIVNADQTLGITIDGMATGSIIECKDYLSFAVSGNNDPDISTLSVEKGDKGSTLLLHMGGALSGELETGVYAFTLPAGLVMNADGAINPQQVITVNVVGTVQGIISPENGAEFEEGEDVSFKIEFEAAPVINPSENAPVIVAGTTTDEKEYNKEYQWEAGVVYTEDKNIVINLGDELEPGTYYLSFREGAVTINGAPNEGVFDVMFTVNANVVATSTTITLNIVDGEDDMEYDQPWLLVNIWDETNMESVTAEGFFTEFTFTGEETTLRIQPEPIDEYELVVSVFDYDSIEDFNASGKGEITVDEGTYYLNLTPESNDLEFKIEVYVAGQAPGQEEKEVTLGFNISGVDNADEVVTLTYSAYSETSEKYEDIEIPINDEGYASVTLTVGKTVDVTPAEGYYVEVSSINDEISISESSDLEGVWAVYIPQSISSDEVIVNITVSKAPNSIYVNFTSDSESIFGNPQDFVTLETEDDFELSSDENKVYLPTEEDGALAFTLTPVEDYAIASFTITDADGEEVSVADFNKLEDCLIEEAEGSYSLIVSNAAANYTFTFNIATEEEVGVNNLNAIDGDAAIYNLQGVRLNKANLKSGIYIINGKKVLVK